MSVYKRLYHPGTISAFLNSIPRTAISATASDVMANADFFSFIPALARKRVMVMPGHKTETETPLFCNSSESVRENESMKDFEAA